MKKLFLIVLLSAGTLISQKNEPMPIPDMAIPTPKESLNFAPPVKIPLLLSGNFGELRSGRFHMGIDIKTRGKVGYRLYAIDSGYVTRISVSPVGFGNCIYINHPSGYTSVYAHMHKFSAPIAKFIDSVQYARQSFSLNLTDLPKNLFPVERGENIGLAGNSGSSGGPHLHLEVRETATQKPVNPLSFNFIVKDNIKPKPYSIYISPYNAQGMINGKKKRAYFATQYKTTSLYSLKTQTAIRVSGKVFFGIKAYDFLNGAQNKCGIYKEELWVDDKQIYGFKIDKASFAEQKNVKYFCDYKELVDKRSYYYQNLSAPYNPVSVVTHKNGVFEFKDDSTHNVRIKLWDVKGNFSEVKFKVKSEKKPLPPPPTPNVFANEMSELTENGVSVSFPKRCVFEDVKLTLKTDSNLTYLSDIIRIGNKNIPLLGKYTLTAPLTEEIPPSLVKKLTIKPLSGGSQMAANYQDGQAVVSLSALGNYAFTFDTIPPSVKPISISGKTGIKVKISDKGTGIGSYVGKVDGKWAKFVYDAKRSLLTFDFDTSRWTTGKNHTLQLTVTDRVGNKSYFKRSFYR